MIAALTIAVMCSSEQTAQPPERPSTEPVAAAPQRIPLKLAGPAIQPTFTVHIKERRLQEIFETPPWQLPRAAWAPRVLPAKTAFGGMPIVSVNLLPIVSAVANERRAAAEHRAAREVHESVEAFCSERRGRGDRRAICDTLVR